MTPFDRTRALAAALAVPAALAVLAVLGPVAAAQDAKPATPPAPAAPAAPGAPAGKPEQSPSDAYEARKPEVMVQVGARFEAVANFAWSNDLKKQALELYKRIQSEFDPNNKKANEQLGYAKRDGTWVPPDEAKQKKLDAIDDGARGSKLHQGELDKKLKEAETSAAKLLADLGNLAAAAGREDEAKGYWRQALDLDDQNAVANEKMGNKLVEGKWLTLRAIHHREYDKAYKTALAKAQDPKVAPVKADDTTGIGEKAGIALVRYKTANFRVESTLKDSEVIQTLKLLEGARQFFIELFGVPERLIEFSNDPCIFMIVLNKSDYEKLVDACPHIAEKDRNFQKKFTGCAVQTTAGSPAKLYIETYPDASNAYAHVPHQATHTMAQYTFGNTAPWLREAIANAVAAALGKAPLSVCFSGEGSTGGIHLENVALDQVPELLRGLIKNKKDSPVSEFVKLPPDGMSPQQIAKAWSVVMYLLELDRTQARDYFAAAGQGTGEASKDEKVLAQFFPDFAVWKDLDAAWRVWALDVYKK